MVAVRFRVTVWERTDVKVMLAQEETTALTAEHAATRTFELYAGSDWAMKIGMVGMYFEVERI